MSDSLPLSQSGTPRVGPESGCCYCSGFNGFHDENCTRRAVVSEGGRPSTQLISIVDADTGESVLHGKRVPEGFSLQLAYRAPVEENADYISILLTPELATQLSDFLWTRPLFNEPRIVATREGPSKSRQPLTASSPPDIAEAIREFDALLLQFERAVLEDWVADAIRYRKGLRKVFRQQQEEIEQSHRDTIYFSAEAGRFANALASLQREQLTPEEAQSILNEIPSGMGTPPLWATDSAIEKLRLRSISSETDKTGDTES